MIYFATYFDQNYLPRVIVLLESLKQCMDEPFHLFALCLDDASYELLEKLRPADVTLIRLKELEQSNVRLEQTKATRSIVEYYYTSGPSFLLFLFNQYRNIDILTYLDSDLYFFSSPQPLFKELDSHSIGIIEHRLSPNLQSYSRFGTYNVGWVSFRRDADGLDCLQWWADRCIEWCHDRVEGRRFADQKYLDNFPRLFGRVRVIQHKGANLAPWNLGACRVTSKDGNLMVDGQPLIFFHFQGLKMIRPWLIDTNFGWYKVAPSPIVRQQIVAPYIRQLKEVMHIAGEASTIRSKTRSVGFLSKLARAVIGAGYALFRRAYVLSLD